MRLWILVFLIALTTTMAQAEGEKAGDFDYYVMSLSWNPNWCATEGDARGAPECRNGAGLSFTLHGLWPQYEGGYPSYCRTTERDPSRSESEAMADIMGGSGLAWYQWKKHGRCAGVPAKTYYNSMRKAYSAVKIPQVFPQINKQLKVPAEVIEGAFLEANPQLRREMVTITCRANRIQEVRICLTKELSPRKCGPDVIRDCTLTDALLDPVR